MSSRVQTPQTPQWYAANSEQGTLLTDTCHPLRRLRRLRTTVACLLLVSCTDPRARPGPPQVELSFSPNLVVKSPGSIVGSLYAYDGDGINTIDVAIRSSDSTFVLDSLVSPADLFQITQSLAYTVPKGMAIGTQIRLVVRVTDFIGFSASDTAFFAVQDTVSAVR